MNPFAIAAILAMGASALGITWWTWKRWYWAVTNMTPTGPGSVWEAWVLPPKLKGAEAIKVPGEFASYEPAKRAAIKFIREHSGIPRHAGQWILTQKTSP